MVSLKLIKYLEEGIKQGFSFLELKQNLLVKGWDEKEIDLAWKSLSEEKVVRESDYSYEIKNVFLFGTILFLLIFGIVLFIVFTNTESVFNEKDIGEGKSFEIVRKPVKILFEEGEANILVEETFTNYSKVKINNRLLRFNISQTHEIDLNSDGINDFLIRLEEIKAGVPKFYVEKIFTISNNTSLENNSLQNEQSLIAPVEENNVGDICEENWNCGSWSACLDGYKTRNCTEIPSCGTVEERPLLNEECILDQCDSGEFSCFEPAGFFCPNGWDSNEFNPFCCSKDCVKFEDESHFCELKSNSFDKYVYFRNNDTHVCGEERNFPFNGTYIYCCSEEDILDKSEFNIIVDPNYTKYIEESKLFCGTDYDLDCGETNISDADTLISYSESGKTTELGFGRECRLACFENALRDNCSPSKLRINLVEEGRDDLIELEILGLLPDGNCSLGFKILRYEDIVPTEINLDGTSMVCPEIINEDSISLLFCPFGFCSEYNMPGMTAIGMSLNFQIILAGDLEEFYGCYGTMVDKTINETIILN